MRRSEPRVGTKKHGLVWTRIRGPGHGVVSFGDSNVVRLLVFVNDDIRLCTAVWVPDKYCSGHGVVLFGDNLVRLLEIVHFVSVDDGPTCGRRSGYRMGDGLELKRECMHPAGICTVVLHWHDGLFQSPPSSPPTRVLSLLSRSSGHRRRWLMNQLLT
jgi:hypothetical protein